MVESSGKFDGNVIKIIQDQLEGVVKDTITQRIVDNQVREFKETITKEIKEIVNQVTFDKVVAFEDLARLSNQVHVYVKWRDEE